MRQVGDPLADAVIAELFAESEIGAVNRLMRDLVTNELPIPDTLPPIVRDYLIETGALPNWADPNLVAAGEQVFWRHGPKLILVLPCYSLPFDYLGRNGVQVLALTTRLASHPARRILETAQFVIDIMQSGGLTDEHGRGRRTIQKVRLMHAAVRRLAPTAPCWKTEYGLPINQEDLAGTLMSFSVVALDGLERLGVALSESDRHAYLHSWLIAAHLLGVSEELLPCDMESANALTAAIAKRQFGPSPEGKEMTRALVDMMAHTLPGDIFRHVAPRLIHYFLGKEQAGWLGIEAGSFAEVLAGPLKLLGMEMSEMLHESKAAAKLAERMAHLLIESMAYVERGGSRPAFSIPTDLREQWGVNWVS
jgi:hypothetical protein